MFRCRWELPHSQLPASRISQHLDRSPTFLRGRLNHQLLQFRYRIFRRYRDLYLRLRRHSWRDGQHNALERNDHEPFLDHCIEHESVLDELNRRNRHARQRHDHQPFLHHRIEYKSFQHERKHRRPLRGHPQSHRPRDLCERVRLPSEFHRRGEFHHDRHQRVHRCEQLHRPRILHASLHDQIFGLRQSLLRRDGDLDIRLRRIPHAPIGLPVASVLDRRGRPFHRGRRRLHHQPDRKRHWLLRHGDFDDRQRQHRELWSPQRERSLDSRHTLTHRRYHHQPLLHHRKLNEFVLAGRERGDARGLRGLDIFINARRLRPFHLRRIYLHRIFNDQFRPLHRIGRGEHDEPDSKRHRILRSRAVHQHKRHHHHRERPRIHHRLVAVRRTGIIRPCRHRHSGTLDRLGYRRRDEDFRRPHYRPRKG